MSQKHKLSISLVALVVATVFICPPHSQAFDSNQLTEANRLYNEQSYQMAMEHFKAFLNDPDLPAKKSDEIRFKFADSSWRTKNSERYDEAEKILKKIADEKVQNEWTARANESLTDYYREKDRWTYGNQIMAHFDKAREYWGGSADIKKARKNYIRVNFKYGDFLSSQYGWYYSSVKPMMAKIKSAYHGQQNLGLFILFEEILKIAKDDKDKARAHYSLAKAHTNYSNQKNRDELSIKHYRKVITDYPESEWLDDAYYELAQFYENRSHYKEALKLYETITSRFREGQSKWYTYARDRIKDIKKTTLRISSLYTYLPNSEIQLNINWRNAKSAKIAIYKINLVNELNPRAYEQPTSSDYGVGNYTRLIENVVKPNRYSQLPLVYQWTVKLKDEGEHKNHSATKGLAEWRSSTKKINPREGILEAGAYLILGEAKGEKAYELIMVSDMALVTKLAGRSAMFFTFDAKTGKPRGNSRIKYHYRYYDANGNWTWDHGEGTTNEKGLLKVSLRNSGRKHYSNQHDMFAVSSNETMQTFTQSNYYSYNNRGEGDWWLYAFTDRPAYRPNEEISFKGIIRNYKGESFLTPFGHSVKAIIHDPRGNKVLEKDYRLNDFGTFADKLTLDDKAPLGEYKIQVTLTDARQNHKYLPQKTLFRLEEYKLPEFLVDIKPKRKTDDPGSSFKIGDTVDVEVEANYYFGGAVSEADVEYLVYQNHYYHYYYPKRKYPWFYNRAYSSNYYGQGQLIEQGKIKTDADGKARFSFDTAENAGNSLQYQIEVRVVDQSRREIKATSSIKVGLTSYLAYLNAKQNLYRPGDTAKVDIKTLDLNDAPQSVEAQVNLTRSWWVDPVYERNDKGEVIKSKVIKHAHYESEKLFTKFIKTDEKGEAVFEFQPERDGFYSVHFIGKDSSGAEIQSSTNVYVCDKKSRDIGYRYGGLQIIAETDTVEPGQNARVMIVSDKPDTWVLFSSEAEEILDAEVFHLDGTVKLLEVPIRKDYIPNFYLKAVSGSKYQLKMGSLELIVPPDQEFLNVKVTSEKQVYQPQEEGNFEIEVTDKNGNPVSAEIALGIIDSSVYYIQSEFRKDIREYFYGMKRNLAVQTHSSFNQRQYMRLFRAEDDKLYDERGRDQVTRRARGAADEIGGGHKLGYSIDQLADMEGSSFSRTESSSLNAVVAQGSLVAEEADARAPAARGFANRKLVKAKKADFKESDAGKGGGFELDTPQIRSDFRSTIIWEPAIVTDKEGKAKVTIKFPDSLTTWRTTARSITRGTKVGNITHDVRTKKDIIVRLQAPRFFTERDEVTISANVHNYTEEEQKIKVTIEAKGIKVTDKESLWVTVPAHGEQRVDWKTKVEKAGKAEILVAAQTKTASDAMVKNYPVIPHGIEKFIAKATSIKTNTAQSHVKEFTINIPKKRIPHSTSLQLNVSPSIAATLLDALPFLARYPYGCVEQTMSRFLPSVIVAKTLKDLGLSQSDIDAYISDVMNPRNDPKGHPKRRTDQTIKHLKKMTNDSLRRLYDFQHSDGGWGWWKKGDSDRFMSAYVVWGLSLAKDAGVRVKQDVINRGVKYLQLQLVQEEDNPDMLAWILHALSYTGSTSQFENTQIGRLWEMRDKLNPYTRALFALSAHNRKDIQRAQVLARNLINGMKEDKDNGTTHWGKSGIHYRWSEGGIEATAFVIKALSKIDPTSPNLDSSVKWMVLNRRGARWKNTRDTAIAILGLTDYLKTTRELNPKYSYKIFLNNKSIRKGEVTSENVFTFGRIINLDNSQLKDGKNTVRVEFNGAGSVYLSGYLKYFTLEENITPEGNEVFVNRKYFKEEKKETLMQGVVSEWIPLESGTTVKSGDRVKVEVTLEAKNHYEYLIVEDLKPAGLEAVSLKSGSGYAETLNSEGEATGNQTHIYQEFRDQKAVFFVDKLKQGKHKITYELRAEVPGEFHGLPNMTHAMYVPEIRANSSEMRIEVED